MRRLNLHADRVCAIRGECAAVRWMEPIMEALKIPFCADPVVTFHTGFSEQA